MTVRQCHSPGDFPDRVEADGVVAEYSELGEIQQGSPLIGKLSVNGVLLSGLFGGPALIARNAVYAPRYLPTERKFELCRITPETLAVTSLMSPQHVVWPERLDGETLYFHRNLYGSELSELDLATGALRLSEIQTPKMPVRAIIKEVLSAPFILIYVLATTLLLLIAGVVCWLWSKIPRKR